MTKPKRNHEPVMPQMKASEESTEAQPTFMRHNHENGKRYGEKVDLQFTREVEPGQKIATEE